MKMIYALLIIGLVLFGYGCFKTVNKKNETKSTNESINKQDNPFNELRNGAFEVTPQQLGIQFSKDKLETYGLIMDWEMDGGYITLVCFKTGDASFYLSSGGGVIGGGQHENVAKSVKELIKMADNYLSKAEKSDNLDLPKKDCVKFHLLTNAGRYISQEKIANFDNNSSLWLKLFESANVVISELREVSEKR